MDLVSLRPWINVVHVVAVLAFVLAHGASAAVAFKLRGERDRTRIAALLDLSGSTIGLLYVALLVILATGIVSGLIAGLWTSGRLWIWVSVAILVAILVAMYAIPLPYFTRLRRALGTGEANGGGDPPGDPVPPASDAELAELLRSRRPFVTAAIGLGGLTVITWLMMLKPF
jgi:hypothetical protein